MKTKISFVAARDANIVAARDANNKGTSSSGGFSATQVTIIVCFALLCQSLVMLQIKVLPTTTYDGGDAGIFNSIHSPSRQQQQQQQQQPVDRSSNPLVIPKGQAVNLPSLRHEDTSLDQKRAYYGGAGDGKHLGGFTELDIQGVSPAVWKHIVQNWNVQVRTAGWSTVLWYHHICYICQADGFLSSFIPFCLSSDQSIE
jgi:hypothetical protein